MAGIVIDLGAGDGKFAYALAKQHPDRLIIALDPNHKAMQKISLKASRKPTKGGLPNLIYALGSLENLPSELSGKVNQVFINFPWAGLLTKLLTTNATAWSRVKNLCQPGALIDILFSTSPQDPLQTINEADLRAKLARLGLMVQEFSVVDAQVLKKYPSSWAKRLAYGRNREYYYMRIINE